MVVVHPSSPIKTLEDFIRIGRETPGKLAVSYRTTGGTESVEGALQIAMAYTGRGKFVSIEDSYHGNSIATMSIGASDNRETFKNLLPNCHKIEPPLDHKALGKVETLLKKRDVAALVTDGVVRDRAGVLMSGLPVWSSGVAAPASRAPSVILI